MLAAAILALAFTASAQAACTDSSSTTAQLQSLLTEGGQGYTLSLCQNQVYYLSDTLNYTASGQEISTEGYPTDATRAVLVVTGTSQATAVNAGGEDLDYVSLRNVQINGNRGSADIFPDSGGLIEFGGPNNGQIVEYVKSYDPRGWSCLHFAEGPFTCTNATISHNDIGPCGHDYFQNWADGISLSCQESLVENNVIVDATDGGIVIFGSPDSTIRNNHISVKTRTMLGGINLVDVLPWRPLGNYTDVFVENNTILGGFATSMGNDTLGPNNASAIVKIGIGIGPRVWFGEQFGTNTSNGGTVRDNRMSGAFVFGIAVSAATNFLVEDNEFFGNTSFIGEYAVNCTGAQLTPHPPVALIRESTTTTNNVTVQDGFANGTAFGLTCFAPPAADVNAWPYGDGGINAAVTSANAGDDATASSSASPSASQASAPSPSPSSAALDLSIPSILLVSLCLGSLTAVL